MFRSKHTWLEFADLGYNDIVKVLLNHRANIFSKTTNGSTARDIAALSDKHSDTVRLLDANGF